MSDSIPHVDVVGAVIVRDGLVFCTQRGSGPLAGLWEFPGGKIELGESPSAALLREIQEELLCEIVVGDQIVTTTFTYEFAVVTLTTFYCRLIEGEPQLTEHVAAQWVAADALTEFDWAPADVPAITQIRADLSSGTAIGGRIPPTPDARAFD